jgi:hypothetical protein
MRPLITASAIRLVGVRSELSTSDRPGSASSGPAFGSRRSREGWISRLRGRLGVAGRSTGPEVVSSSAQLVAGDRA